MLKCRLITNASGEWQWQVDGEQGPIAISRTFRTRDDCLEQARLYAFGCANQDPLGLLSEVKERPRRGPN